MMVYNKFLLSLENLSGFIKLPRRKSTKSMKHWGISKERGSSLVKINKIEVNKIWVFNKYIIDIYHFLENI